jgi:hypothetical protein
LEPGALTGTEGGLFGNVRALAKEIFNKEAKNPAYPARFVVLLKALVESDIGPKPARQKQVIDKYFSLFDEESQALNDVLLRTKDHNYDVSIAHGMYEKFKE